MAGLLIAAVIVLAANLLFALRTLQISFASGDAIAVSDAPAEAPFLSILVPARNEARNIERCVRSLLAQAYPAFEVIVIDDRSEDATAEILAALANGDARMRMLRGEPLPQGWVGKPWALVQGTRIARGEWLLFTDAETVHQPRALASVLNAVLERSLDGLSLLTTQELGSFAERAFLPTILWMIAFAVGGQAEVNDPRRPDRALFNGRYILMRRDAYANIGGHAVVRDCIAEDYEFAHLVKRDGRYRMPLLGANDLVRTRMYHRACEIWDGLRKNLALGARGQTAPAILAMLFFACISPGAPLLALLGGFLGVPALALAGLVAIGLSSAAAEIGMRRMRLPTGSGLWLVLGVPGMVAIFANSLRLHVRLRGVLWRGRRYAG